MTDLSDLEAMEAPLDQRRRLADLHIARLVEMRERKLEQALIVRNSDGTATGERAAQSLEACARALEWAIEKLS